MALPGNRANKAGGSSLSRMSRLSLYAGRHAAELGFTVAGTVAQVPEAIAFIEGENPIDAALLDVNIGAQKIDPVADLLAARACPLSSRPAMAAPACRSPHNKRAVVQKPFRLEEIAAALRSEMSAARRGAGLSRALVAHG